MKKNLIGIIADTHDNRNNITSAVELFNKKGVSLVIHCGDFIAPFTALDFKMLTCSMEMVFGNNDGEKVGLTNAFKNLGTILPGPRSFVFGGRKFLIMHEPGCLEEIINTKSVDIIIYGHTHKADVKAGAPLVINPGEAGGWVEGKATVAILDIDTMSATIHLL